MVWRVLAAGSRAALPVESSNSAAAPLVRVLLTSLQTAAECATCPGCHTHLLEQVACTLDLRYEVRVVIGARAPLLCLPGATSPAGSTALAAGGVLATPRRIVGSYGAVRYVRPTLLQQGPRRGVLSVRTARHPVAALG